MAQWSFIPYMALTTEPTKISEKGLTIYLVNPDIADVDQRETDPLTGNIM